MLSGLGEYNHGSFQEGVKKMTSSKYRGPRVVLRMAGGYSNFTTWKMLTHRFAIRLFIWLKFQSKTS